MYTLKGLKDAASFLKKSGTLKNFAVTKATKAELEKVLKDYSYDMSQIKSIKTKSKTPKKVTGKVFRAIYPAKPVYNLKNLRKQAMELKKLYNLKEPISKMNKSQLINLISESGQGLSIAQPTKFKTGKMTAYQKKGGMPKKRGRPRKNKQPRTQTITPAPVVAGQRRRGRPKGSKNKPLA